MLSYTVTVTTDGACCCGGVGGCCGGGLPDTLHATITSDCACGGGTVVLTGGGGTWTGSGPFGSCGVDVTLTLTCAGPLASDFMLRVQLPTNGVGLCTFSTDETHGDNSGPADPTCDPLELPFVVTGTCCTTTGISERTVFTVTL